jgi:hypothetical protein
VHFAGGVRFENVELKVDDFTTLAFYGSRKVGGGNPDFKATLANGGVVVEPAKGPARLRQLRRGLHRARRRPDPARHQ